MVLDSTKALLSIPTNLLQQIYCLTSNKACIMVLAMILCASLRGEEVSGNDGKVSY